MCPIPSCFLDRAISLHNSNIGDKEEILRTVSNTGIYCSSDKVGTVYLVYNTFSKIPRVRTLHYYGTKQFQFYSFFTQLTYVFE
jgi:hypothetical protein